jgi:hypothetical protein
MSGKKSLAIIMKQFRARNRYGITKGKPAISWRGIM